VVRFFSSAHPSTLAAHSLRGSVFASRRSRLRTVSKKVDCPIEVCLNPLLLVSSESGLLAFLDRPQIFPFIFL
jgi:hypothetical protein